MSMEWDDFKYTKIAKQISEEEINIIIQTMIDNSDNSGKYYLSYRAEDFVRNHIHNSVFFSIVDDVARREIENEGYDIRDPLLFEYRTDSEYEEAKIRLRKEKIYELILDQIELEARRKRKERFFMRLNIGDIVDFGTCVNRLPFYGKVEFNKDGGWGIAEEDGRVIVKNHLICKPSDIIRLANSKDCAFYVIQDRDTEQYGVLSLKTFKETIHCLYDKIEVVKYQQGNILKHIFKVKKNNRWGCYDENCTFIIECKYDEIRIVNSWIECCRDGEVLNSEIDLNKFDSLYDGEKDLYDIEGNLLLGGYNYFEFERKYFKFFFNTRYESYDFPRTTIYNDEIMLLQYRLNYDDACCLVLDQKFNSLLANGGQKFQIPLGKVFQSSQEIEENIPKEFLLYGYVNMSDFLPYIYLEKRNSELFFVSNFHKDNIYVNNRSNINSYDIWTDQFLEDDEVVIMGMTENGNVSWHSKVNEIGPVCMYGRIYRLGDKVGIYTRNGISRKLYDAISIDSQDKKVYAAQIRQQYNEVADNISNPNYHHDRHYSIQYFEIKETGELEKQEDDWGKFNPNRHKWFPYNFLSKNQIFDEQKEEDVEGDDDSYTNEDSDLSYEKYGGYNGYDDDTIDYGFDGCPDATWNVD